MGLPAALVAALLLAGGAGDAGRTVTGVVLDRAGRPVPGAPLALLEPRASGAFHLFYTPFPPREFEADERGAFRIQAPAGKVAIVAQQLVEGRAVVRVVPVPDGPGSARVTVRFDGGLALRGTALDEHGRPLAGVRVTVIPDPAGAAAIRGDGTLVRGFTDGEGRFDLPGLVPGDYRLLAKGKGYTCVQACEYKDGMPVRPGAGRVSVPLVPTGWIEGRVLTADDRGVLRPVEAFQIWSAAFDGGWVTPQDGRFEVDVPRLWARAPLFIRAPGLAAHVSTFEMPKPAAIDLGDVVLTPGRTVHGVVRDAAGAPVAGARVWVGYRSRALDAPMGTTDARGEFVIEGVVRGSTPLTILHPDHLTQEVVVGEPPAIEVRLQAGASLAVRVVGPDGAPLARLGVRAVKSKAVCTTGADGACALTGLEVKPEVIEVVGLAVGWPRAPQLRVPASALGGPPVVVRVARQPSRLEVTVVEPAGTFAQAIVEVLPGEVPPERVRDEKDEPAAPFFATGIDLVKRVENLAPGRYTVVATSAALPRRCAVTTVELTEGGEHPVTVRLPDAPGPCRP